MSGLGRTHAISLTPHGADGTAAYLLADVADVDHDGVLTAVKVRLLPDALVEVLRREDFVGIGGQQQDDAILQLRQRYLPTLLPHGAGGGIHLQPAAPQPPLQTGGPGAVDAIAPQERPFEGADDYEKPARGRSSVLDLLLPVVVLIVVCIVSLIWSGGYYDGESEYFLDFVGAFSNSSSGMALALGGLMGMLFTVVYFWLRGAISFEKSMESVPQGFIQMIAPILILTFAWTLCSFTRFGMYSAVFVKNAMAGAGDLKVFLPAVIFLIGCAIGFATGTSWGTIGIMAPIVVSVFNYDVEPVLCTIGLAAACSGGVMGDHCSPISDTTIMASAGAHCFHLNHVFTQLPYALTASGVAFVSFIIAGLVQSVWLCLAIAVALMIGTLLVIRAIVSRRHAGIFQEMAQASQQLLHR